MIGEVGRVLRFFKDHWQGNRWPCIEIDPLDQGCFFTILAHLATTYGFAPPAIIDTIDGYCTDFSLAGQTATLQIDAWSFSFACPDLAVRDMVFDHLQSLPPDFFDDSD